MLSKQVYSVGKAANHQSNSDIENYKKRHLNKPISNTAVISQHTWKCATKRDIVGQNWTQNCVAERAKGITYKAEYFCTAAILY